MAPPVRWGIVGTGNVASAMASDLAAGNALAVAVCSRSADSADSFGDAHGIPARHDDLARFLADDAAELVYVATPHATHLPIGLAALRAGKHVVIEKPLALTGVEARALTEAAAAADRFLMEAMWMRFGPAFQDVVRLVHEGRIGTVRSVRASFGHPFPRNHGSRWSADMGGSALLDQGIYPVVLARTMMGDPDRITSSATWFGPNVDATAWVTLEWPDGRFAQLAASMVEYLEPTASVHGTEGWIRLDPPFWASGSIAIHSGNVPGVLFDPERRFYQIEGNGFVPMIRAVGDAIRADEPEHALCSLTDTCAALDLLDRIRTEIHRRDSRSGDRT
jgi:predicted dehydrogenase